MKFDDFKNKFYCVFSIEETNENTLIVNTKVKRRNDNVVIDQVYTKIDIQSTNQWINDSQSIISISEWN